MELVHQIPSYFFARLAIDVSKPQRSTCEVTIS